jgi:glycine reductase
VLSAGELEAAVRRAVPGLRSVCVSTATPGERTRIVGVKDAIEPRAKVAGERPGEGRVHALAGLAVVTCGRVVGFQEGIVDMSGPGAAHSPLSSLRLVVLELDVAPETEPHAHEAALREAGLAAAAWLARLAAGAEPGSVERFALPAVPAERGLPRVAYVYMLLCQGLLHDTYVFGQSAREGLPRAVDPRVVFEGAIVSGNCVSACDKNTTWHHQQAPVVRALLRRHGRELDFAGAVLTPSPIRLAEKQAAARRTVDLVRELGAAGAVISKEGFGNPDADLMMLVRGLEAEGVRSVAITDEFAGEDGASQSLADTAAEADALVSVGNANERVVLAPMERWLGPAGAVPRLAGGLPGSLRADGSVEVELQAIVGATNPLGQGRLTCREV